MMISNFCFIVVLTALLNFSQRILFAITFNLFSLCLSVTISVVLIASFLASSLPRNHLTIWTNNSATFDFIWASVNPAVAFSFFIVFLLRRLTIGVTRILPKSIFLFSLFCHSIVGVNCIQVNIIVGSTSSSDIISAVQAVILIVIIIIVFISRQHSYRTCLNFFLSFHLLQPFFRDFFGLFVVKLIAFGGSGRFLFTGGQFFIQHLQSWWKGRWIIA
mmetsp:Transcript_18073/g.26746  ORF Transcript_18073/g.26746 Transcript_18073/m.26746 type:complete len:218 (-) Transcript_18073:950-1603(-)